jgi:hypothetical protein
MSEHTWILENLASYTAGGLEAAERERLQQHIAACPSCAEALEQTQAFDQTLETLFAPARPGPALEDRMVRALRSAPRRFRFPRPAMAAAAVLLVGVIGAGVSRLVGQDELLFPGNWKASFAGKIAGNKLGSPEPSGSLALSDLSKERSTRSLDDLGKELRDGTSNSVASTVEDRPIQVPQLGSSGGRNQGAGRLGDLSVNEAGSPAWSRKSATESPRSAEQLARQLREEVASTVNGELSYLGDKPTSELATAVGSYAPSGALDVDKKRDDRGVVNGSMGTSVFSFDGSRPAAATPSPTAPMRGPPASMRPPAGIFERPIQNAAVNPAGNPRGEDVGGPLSTPEARKSEAKPVERLAEPATPPQKDSFGEKNKPPQPAPDPAARRKIVIRTGEIEFEITSFDSGVAAVTRLVNDIKGGYVDTVNSEKLANGKVRGTVVVRVPPEHLDSLILDLRKELGKGGELKSLRVGSQDITKQYTDLESRLRAARTMEERLLQIIKAGKGEIKDLLQAEKELGVWRTRIEEIEGELRYYASQVALSTLTISLYEREIRSPYGVIETERVQMGVEVEDVDKAQQAVLAAVADAKGRVTKSELKQQAVGQFIALLHFEVAPEAAGPLRDRLRQIGTVTRLDIDRLQQTEGGSGRPQDGRTKRNDTQFLVSLYNAVTPRETVVLQVAARDVPAAYRSLQQAVTQAHGRVLNAQLNEQDRQNVTGQLDFDIRRADEPAINTALGAGGEIFSRNATRAAEAENVSDARVRLQVSLISLARVPPRETVVLAVEVRDVDQTAANFSAQVSESRGRTAESHMSHERSGRVTAKLVYDVPLSAAATLVERFKGAGTVRVQQSSRNLQVPEGPLAVARIDVTLSNAELIVPSDEGLWPQVRRGLWASFVALSWSVTVVIVGVCFVLPWALIGYAVYRLALRFRRGVSSAPSTPA